MKWPRFVTSIGISRLCRGLALLALLKLAVLGVAAWDGAFPGLSHSSPARVVAEAVQPSQALAQSGDTGGQAAPQADAPAADAAPAADVPAADAAASPAATKNLQELQAKEEELNRREASLNQLEQDIDAKLARLHDMETRLKGMLEQADVLKDQKLKHLVNVYSNMKAKQAAQVLETLDEGLAVKILAGMQGRQAGEVLTFVSPKKAAKLSESLTKLQTQF